MPEIAKPYKKRYGNVAIEKGFITPEQLTEALNQQVMKEIHDGEHHLIGVILYDLGYITLEQDLEVLNSLEQD